MNILFSISQVDGWVRAANYLGHNGFILDENHIFDSFYKAKPDLFITFGDNSKELKKCLLKFPTKIVPIDSYLPAADCPPNFIGGEIKNNYKCDAIIIGSYNKDYDKYLIKLSNSSLNFKIFGSGNWNIPQFVGWINPLDIPSAYASAKWSLDLEGELNRILAISSSGGNPLSVGKWTIGIEQLDNCPNFSSPVQLIEQIKSNPIKFNTKTPTLADRLQEILEDIYGNLDSNKCEM